MLRRNNADTSTRFDPGTGACLAREFNQESEVSIATGTTLTESIDSDSSDSDCLKSSETGEG